MKTNFILALAVIVSLASLAAASDRLIISEQTIIDEGDSLVLAPGAVVLFGELTGITVKGRLVARGTADEPIKFASVNDTSGTATPFDWNGIEITGAGRATLSHVHFSGATSGIVAERPRGVILEDCVFENNGQWNLSVAGEVQEVPNSKPYNYSVAALVPVKTPDAPAIDTTENLTTGETSAAVTTERKPQKMSRVKLGIQIPAAALAAGGIAGGIYYNEKINTELDKYKKATTTPEAISAREAAENKTNKYETYRTALYILGAVGLTGFTITLFF